MNGDDRASGKVNLLPVKVEQEDQVALILRINDRHSLEIYPGFDPDLLSKVIQALKQVV